MPAGEPDADGASYVKFAELLEQAYAEGRVDGPYRCPVCGMRYQVAAEAAGCCAMFAPSKPEGAR